MIDKEKVLKVKEVVLTMEKENLSNIEPLEDKNMVAKIMEAYEEIKNDNQ